MEKIIPEYTAVDLSRWARKEHFEVFQGFAQSTFNQTVLVDITVLLSHIKNVGWKFYPTIIFLVAKIVNRHPEFRMAMKDNELVIWNEIHPNYTISIMKQRPFHHYGVITMAIYSTFRKPILKTWLAMAINLRIGQKKNPGKISFLYPAFRG